jgi:hypothetical protein
MRARLSSSGVGIVSQWRQRSLCHHHFREATVQTDQECGKGKDRLFVQVASTREVHSNFGWKFVLISRVARPTGHSAPHAAKIRMVLPPYRGDVKAQVCMVLSGLADCCRNQAIAQLCAFHSPFIGLMSEIEISQQLPSRTLG